MFIQWRLNRLAARLAVVHDEINALLMEVKTHPSGCGTDGPYYGPRLEKLYYKANMLDRRITALLPRL
jgi:hypothetical protein